jgi:hypothetical protein
MYASILSLVVAVAAVTQDATVNRSSVHSPKQEVAYQKDDVAVVRCPIRFLSAKDAYTTLKLAHYEGVNFLSYDPTDNSVVVRGTQEGRTSIILAIRKIDQDPWKGPIDTKKFRVMHQSAEVLYRVLVRQSFKGVSYLTFDPTDNSILVRGVPGGMSLIAKRLAELDKE